MAALTQDPENARPSFIKLRELKQKLAALLAGTPHTLQHLSMGMSGDYEVAIEEGATLIRLVALQVADHVPAAIGYGVGFAPEFLGAIFAKIFHPQGEQVCCHFGLNGLGHSH